MMRNTLGAFLRHRELVWELTKRDVRDKYAGHSLGRFWAIGYPLFLLLLYVLIFGYVFPARLGDAFEFPRSYTVYILAGLIPWLTFQELLSRAVTSISSNSGLVKQIVFPIGVLPVKTVLGTVVSQVVATCLFAVYIVMTGEALAISWLLVPLLWTVQIFAMVGAAYFLGAVGVYTRDLRDIVQVFSTANLFMQPILFLPGNLPPAIEKFLYLNPFSYMTWCYQDAIYYGRLEHPLAWILFPVLSVVTLYTGYTVFERLRTGFGDVV